MTCFRCGGSVPTGNVCPHCGQVLPAAEVETGAAAQAPHAGTPLPPSPPGKKRRLAGPIAVGAAAVLAAVCLVLAGRNLMSGLPLLPLLALCGLFAVFLAVDILGHRLLRITRSIGHWCVLAVVACGFLCSGTGAVLSRIDTGAWRLNLDFAYRYLLDGHGEAARERAQLCPEEDRELLTLLADAADREYLSVYFQADRLLAEGGLEESTAAQVLELRSLAAGVLGVPMDPETGEITGTAADLPLTDEEAAASPAAVTETQRRERMDELVREICDQRGAAEAMQEKTEELYRLDKAMTLNDLSGLDPATVEELLSLYPEDEDVLLVAIKYYTRQNDYGQARLLAQKLVGLDDSESNLVVYTDLIAQ